MHNYIDYFNPDVTSLEKAYRDFNLKVSNFNAGCGYRSFNLFITDDAQEYKENGDGVTYVVWNVFRDENNNETDREVVAYYTLSTTAIPYIDRIRLDDDEAKATGRKYDVETCAISAIQIKMFAVDVKYQDVFYKTDKIDLPISAIIMRNIIDYAYHLINNVVGFRALYLHSVPEAEQFYYSNGFRPLEINMIPFNSVDSELTAMYFPIINTYINYDK